MTSPVSPYLNQPRRTLLQLERRYLEDAAGYLNYAAKTPSQGTRQYWEGRAREAQEKALEARRQRIKSAAVSEA